MLNVVFVVLDIFIKNDIIEVKFMKNFFVVVKFVMEVCCIMKGVNIY